MKTLNQVLSAFGLIGCGSVLLLATSDPEPVRAAEPVVPMPPTETVAEQIDTAVQAEQGEQVATPKPADAAAAAAKNEALDRPAPKALTKHVEDGLAWLIAHQNNDGGWGQGEESTHMGRDMDQVRDVSNVADSSMAVLALQRAGSTPTDGPHADAIVRGVKFVCKSVDASEPDSLWITDVRGTRLQGKIGQFIDTFVAALMLSEVTGQMPDEETNQQVSKTLDVIIAKIEKNQQADGKWKNQGWAGGLGMGMGVKALNRAAQRGVDVDMDGLLAVQEAVRSRSTLQADGVFGDAGDNAGIELYAAASEVGQLNDYATTNAAALPAVQSDLSKAEARGEELQTKLARAEAEGDAKAVEELTVSFDENNDRLDGFRRKIDNIELTEDKLAQVRGAALLRFDDEEFVAGFGNNGGEEFLSYLQVGEALAAQGGNDFRKWDQNMTENLNRIQNQDGSWSGHHCITGRTFCTSAALLVLTVDRAPTPVAAMGQDR